MANYENTYHPQVHTIDLTGSMLDPQITSELGNMPTLLKLFLTEIDNPVLSELAQLYKQDPNLTIKDGRIQKLTEQLRAQLENFNSATEYNIPVKSTTDIANPELNFGDSTKSMASHLAFIYQSLKNSHNLSDLMLGYKHTDGTKRIGLLERLNGQFDKDCNRIPFKLVGQHGEILEEEINDRIAKELEAAGKPTNGPAYIAKLQEVVKITPEQLDIIRQSYNQRYIIGAGTAFLNRDKFPSPSTDNRQDILHVIDDKGKLTLQSIEYREEINGDKTENGLPVLDENDQRVKAPLYAISCKFCFKKNAPAEKIITTVSLSPEGEITLPKSLEKRDLNISLEQAIMKGDQARVKDIFSMVPIDTQDNLITTLVRTQIRKEKSIDPQISQADLAEKIQNNLVENIMGEQLKPENIAILSQGINNYITHENPSILTKLVQQVKAIRDTVLHARFISREEYQKDKISRQITKLAGMLKHSHLEVDSSTKSAETKHHEVKQDSRSNHSH